MLVNAPNQTYKLPQRRTMVRLVVLVLLVAVAFGAWRYWERPKTVHYTPEQQKVANTIQNQQVDAVQEEQQNRPNGTKSISFANLAQSYAYTKQCDQAHQALAKAEQYVTPDTQQNLQNSKQEIKYYCH